MHKPGIIALRPLTLADFFEGAFKTIRRNPTAMVGLAALVTSAFMIVPVLISLSLAALGELSTGDTGAPFGLTDSGFDNGSSTGMLAIASNLGAFFGLFATVVLNGMLVRVVAEAVLGRRTTIAEAWVATRGRLWRLIGLMLLNLVFVMVLFAAVVVVSVVVGFQAGSVQGSWSACR